MEFFLIQKKGILFTQKKLGFFLIEKILFIFVRKKPEVLHEKLKIVLPMGILKKKISTPHFTKFLNPQENFSALFYPYSNLS